MKRPTSNFGALAVALVACKGGKTDDVLGGEDTSPYSSHDTFLVHDSGQTDDTDTVVHGDTTDSSIGDTGDSGGPALPDLSALVLYPGDLVVGVGATFPSRLVATWTDGSHTDVAAASYDVSSPEVARISMDGVVDALGAGTTTLTAHYGGKEGSVSLEVRDDNELHVVVVDALTGLPIEGANVKVNGGDRVLSDKSGMVVVPLVATLSLPPLAPPSDTGTVDTSLPVDTGTPIDTGTPVDTATGDTGPHDSGSHDTGSGDTGSAPAPTGAPIVIDVYEASHVPLTILNTVNRDFVVELHSRDGFVQANATIDGAVNFDAVPSGSWSDMTVGMAAASIQNGLVRARPEDLFSAERTLSVYGIDVDMPANLYLKGHAEDYEANATAGHPAVWSICGPLPIADVTGGLSGVGDAMALVMEHISDMVWTWKDGTDVSAGGTIDVDIAPSLPLDRSLLVDVGSLSLGFSGDEDPLVFVGEMMPVQGFVVTGLGVGSGAIDIHAASPSMPESTGQWAWMLAQVGGLGSGNAYVVTAAPLTGATATLPPMPQPPSNDFLSRSLEFGITSDPATDFVHVVMLDSKGVPRELVMTGGDTSGTLVRPPYAFDYSGASWDVVAYETSMDTFEGWVRHAELSDDDVAPLAFAAGRVKQKF